MEKTADAMPAAATAIISETRTAFMEERATPLEELLQRMADMDAVLVEGFKRERHPKIVLVREAEDVELVRTLSHVAAVVCCLPVPTFDVPVFMQDGTDDLVEWVVRQYYS